MTTEAKIQIHELIHEIRLMITTIMFSTRLRLVTVNTTNGESKFETDFPNIRPNTICESVRT